MQKKLIDFNLSQRAKKMPDFQSGDVVKVYRKIKEGEKERIQIFEGLIIAIKGRQSSSPTITVRKVSEGIGVELVLPIYSKGIEKIELVKRAGVRRAKLYYLRGLTAKKSRMKYKDISAFVVTEEKLEEKEIEESKEATTETPKKKNPNEEAKK
jgi:large subunit ribosomal protein L19